MCIIVDANRLGALLSDPAAEDAAPIRRWLHQGGRIVYSTGGAFGREVGRRMRDRLLDYARAGRAEYVPAGQFADDERTLRDHPDLRSDDAHVLALARKTGVRLLYTGDRDLIEDFKDKQFIDRPRGKVYTHAANARLLAAAACAARAR